MAATGAVSTGAAVFDALVPGSIAADRALSIGPERQSGDLAGQEVGTHSPDFSRQRRTLREGARTASQRIRGVLSIVTSPR